MDKTTRMATRKTPAKPSTSKQDSDKPTSGVKITMTKDKMGHIEKTNAVREKHGVSQQETGDVPNTRTPSKRGREEEVNAPTKSPKKPKKNEPPTPKPPSFIHKDDQDVQPLDFDPRNEDDTDDDSFVSDEHPYEACLRIVNLLLTENNHKLSFHISKGSVVLKDDTIDHAFTRMSVDDERISVEPPKSVPSLIPVPSGAHFTLVVPGRSTQRDLYFSVQLNGEEMMNFDRLSREERIDYLVDKAKVGKRYAYSHNTKEAHYTIN